METWQIIVALITVFFGAGGIIGGVVTLLITRKFAKNDKKEEIHDTNQAAAIAASTSLESQFRTDLLSRVQSLESEAVKIRELDRELAVENQGLKKDNEHLTKQNADQAEKIGRLSQENVDLRGGFKILENRFEALKQELTATTNELHAVKSQLSRMGNDPAIEIEKEVLRRIGSIELNRPQKIVIIDDNPEHLLMMSEVLRSVDLEAIPFETGGEAIEWLRQNHAAVIVSDLAIDKDLDGLTVIEKIRGHERRNRKVPAHIIIYSGFEANDGIREDARLLNVEAIFRKATHPPQDVAELIKTLISPLKPAVEASQFE